MCLLFFTKYFHKVSSFSSPASLLTFLRLLSTFPFDFAQTSRNSLLGLWILYLEIILGNIYSLNSGKILLMYLSHYLLTSYQSKTEETVTIDFSIQSFSSSICREFGKYLISDALKFWQSRPVTTGSLWWYNQISFLITQLSILWFGFFPQNWIELGRKQEIKKTKLKGKMDIPDRKPLPLFTDSNTKKFNWKHLSPLSSVRYFLRN